MYKYLRKINALFPKQFVKGINKYYLAIYIRRFLFLFFVILIGVLLQLLVVLNTRYVRAQQELSQKRAQYEYWISVASQFPNVPDVLYNAAVSSLAMGQKDEALEFIEKSLRIDPLFKSAVSLREKIQ